MLLRLESLEKKFLSGIFAIEICDEYLKCLSLKKTNDEDLEQERFTMSSQNKFLTQTRV